MRMLYDTRTVHPLDRYECYRAGAAAELAPVSVHGRSPGQLLAVVSVVRISDFGIGVLTWAADGEVVVGHTGRLIRAGDPEAYRILVGTTHGLRVEQADHRLDLRARDIGLIEPAAMDDPGLAEVRRECVAGLIRQRLGEPPGIRPHMRRLLQQAWITGMIRRQLGNPALDPDGIAIKDIRSAVGYVRTDQFTRDYRRGRES